MMLLSSAMSCGFRGISLWDSLLFLLPHWAIIWSVVSSKAGVEAATNKEISYSPGLKDTSVWLYAKNILHVPGKIK